MFPTQALRIKAFRHLWAGQAISQFGDAFYYVVFMFMVAKLTGEPKMVGFVGAAETLPFLLFSAYAGVVADRLDRRKIMLLSDLLCGGVLMLFGALIVFNQHPASWILLVTPFVLSCVRVFFIPAKNAAIPALVPEDMLLKANALSSMTQSFMPLFGLAMSASVLGVLYAISKTWFFVAAIVVNALSFFASAHFVNMLPAIIPDRKDEEKHPLTEFVEGLRYISHRKVIAIQIALASLANLMISPFFVVYVITNDQWFSGKPQTLTWCETVFFLGLVSGSMLIGRFRIRRPGMSYILNTTIVGLAIMVMGFSHNLWLYLGWNFVCGLAIPFLDVPMTTYVQLEVEDAFRGRVNSVQWMLRAGIMPIGMASAGLFVKSVGLVNAYLVMGGGMAFAALLGLASRSFRGATMPEPKLEVVANETAEAAMVPA